MNTRIFEKAMKVIKYIILEANTEYEEYYKFQFPSSPKDIQVSLHQGLRGGLRFHCTCKFHSVRNPQMTRLCSFVIATIRFKKNGRN